MAVAGCGGGDGDGGTATGSASCEVSAQNEWLRTYLDDWYYWSGAAPRPDPAGYDSLQAYFEASRYPGDGVVPRDHWSYFGSSAAYEQFYGEGRTLGYGLFVNGIEGTLPLKARYIEPLSPSGLAGVARGDTIVSVNGRSAAELVAANDFAALSPAREGDTLTLEIDGRSGRRSLVLTAATYALTPLSVAKVLTLPGGARAGYLVLKDFITQAEAPLAEAFAQFRQAGATELILDLRYNGGGRVSTSNVLASLVSGAAHGGGTFAQLHYNARHTASNTVFSLAAQPGPVFGRVVILTGSRTCSASELLVNGLKPFADVVTIGGTTCGKPFGFNPVQSCGNSFSAVNFEAFNAAGEGRYYGGIAARCAVADDFIGELGDPAETLTAAASSYLQSGACPLSAQRAQPLSAPRRRGPVPVEPGDRQGMVP
ncbi:S41 family peptidase [Piscinibacter sp. XHJ-5]|uniref:S41 family peptidase n=1 Tax=Piscinibacter sp. XHJ-5 TaxID=3037797 RepID=UPI0024533733|nr:S41 family peptidase [Piscinibacter sp. XHJ-5]